MNSTLPRGSFKNCLGENFNIIEFKVQCYEHENLGNFPDIDFGTFSNLIQEILAKTSYLLNNPRSICVFVDGIFAT